MSKIIVKPLFRGPQYLTTVWIADDVTELLELFINNAAKDALPWIAKAEYYAKAGFHRHEGKSEGIRAKWGGIYAIQPWASLFRLYGFYAQPQKRDFVIVSTTMKRGQKMRDSDKAEVDNAAEIYRTGNWGKDESGT